MATKADLHKVNQVNASTNQQGTYMKSFDSTKKNKKKRRNLIIIASNVEKEVTMHENANWSLGILPTRTMLKC